MQHNHVSSAKQGTKLSDHEIQPLADEDRDAEPHTYELSFEDSDEREIEAIARYQACYRRQRDVTNLAAPVEQMIEHLISGCCDGHATLEYVREEMQEVEALFISRQQVIDRVLEDGF